ncbi:hypothetical protein SAMN04489841_3763 [Natrinema salaciae]|uniref:Uncharacterized protein n=1 Tax=Natrinema salaciae TaxID=1186196 RepID=A0A1H9NVP9_9EURY|nr:hypothetical protein SAMN04489841_3763 [Natrinema salaciae]
MTDTKAVARGRRTRFRRSDARASGSRYRHRCRNSSRGGDRSTDAAEEFGISTTRGTICSRYGNVEGVGKGSSRRLNPVRIDGNSVDRTVETALAGGIAGNHGVREGRMEYRQSSATALVSPIGQTRYPERGRFAVDDGVPGTDSVPAQNRRTRDLTLANRPVPGPTSRFRPPFVDTTVCVSSGRSAVLTHTPLFDIHTTVIWVAPICM